MNPLMLETPRLWLVPTPLAVVRARLLRAGFDADVETPAGVRSVHFPQAWPGDALVFFPALAQLKSDAPDAWGGTAIERASGVAIGMLGGKGGPDDAGRIEIGYGLIPEAWGQGYATESVRALTLWLLARSEVQIVAAETSVENFASQRVLEKCGFLKVGERTDPEDGPLYLWEKLTTY